jgi:hypothetical protein
MAMNASHAATHDDRTFSVEGLSGGETATVLDAALSDPRPEGYSPSPSERLDVWLRSGTRLRLRQDFLAVWDDRRSRWCLILGAVCLWLTLTLVEPSFLAPLLVAAVGLWSRRGHRAVSTSEGLDDWF